MFNYPMKRIGLLIPSSNTTMEPDFYAMTPPGITIHTSRMFLRDVSPESLEDMAGEALRAARLLETAGVDVLIYGCTSGSLLKGKDWEAQLTKKIETHVHIPTITTAGSVVEGLRGLNSVKIAVFTPYIDEINALEKAFLESYGFQVTWINGLGLRDNIEIGKTSPETIKKLIESHPVDVDAVFVSCTNLPVLGLIEELEAHLGVPVVTSNQASIWAALKMLKLQSAANYGRLLKIH